MVLAGGGSRLPKTVRMFAPRTAKFALIRVNSAVNIELPHDVFPSGQIKAIIVTVGLWRTNIFLVKPDDWS